MNAKTYNEVHEISTTSPEKWETHGYPLPPHASRKDEDRWGSMDPSEQRRTWWLIMSGGNMSDMSTAADLHAFIVEHLKNPHVR